MKRNSMRGWIWIPAVAMLMFLSSAVMARQNPQEVGGRAQPAAEAASVTGNTGQADVNDIGSQKKGTALPAQRGAPASGLKGVMAVTLIIWVGLFAYVYRLDRKVRRLEGS